MVYAYMHHLYIKVNVHRHATCSKQLRRDYECDCTRQLALWREQLSQSKEGTSSKFRNSRITCRKLARCKEQVIAK